MKNDEFISFFNTNLSKRVMCPYKKSSNDQEVIDEYQDAINNFIIDDTHLSIFEMPIVKFQNFSKKKFLINFIINY